jgi:hypothetical protein
MDAMGLFREYREISFRHANIVRHSEGYVNAGAPSDLSIIPRFILPLGFS